MSSRVDWNTYFMAIAGQAATRSTCDRKHVGAVIVRDGRIEAARCILPVSTSMRLSPQLGLRHRAAVGLSEQTDAFVVVVSEETGTVSVAQGGNITQGVTTAQLRGRLIEALSPRLATPAPEIVEEA